MLPSELTNTIKQFSVYVHRNEPQFTYIYVYHTNVLEDDNIYKNPPPKCHFTYNCVLFLFRSGAPPMILLNDGALTDPQLPATASHLYTTDARLGGVGRVPPNKNPGYAGDFDGAKYTARATHVEIVIKQATWVTICTTVDKQLDDGRHQDMHKL